MANALGERSGKEQVVKKNAVMNFRPVNAFFKSIPKPQKRRKGVLNRVYVVIFSCLVAKKENRGRCERVRVDHILFLPGNGINASQQEWVAVIGREHRIQMQL